MNITWSETRRTIDAQVSTLRELAGYLEAYTQNPAKMPKTVPSAAAVAAARQLREVEETLARVVVRLEEPSAKEAAKAAKEAPAT